MWEWMEKLETMWKAISFLHMLHFLWEGMYVLRCCSNRICSVDMRRRYVSPIDRLLRMRLVPKRLSMPRLMNFEVMNRILLWSSFTVRTACRRPAQHSPRAHNVCRSLCCF